jgi:hypothetical protein
MWACRRLLRNAVVQLLDVHHNPAALPGVAVRWRLLLKESGSRADEAAAPQLCCSSGGQQLVSDDNGRAFFGDVAVEQDTGRMVSGTDPDLSRSGSLTTTDNRSMGEVASTFLQYSCISPYTAPCCTGRLN